MHRQREKLLAKEQAHKEPFALDLEETEKVLVASGVMAARFFLNPPAWTPSHPSISWTDIGNGKWQMLFDPESSGDPLEQLKKKMEQGMAVNVEIINPQ